MTSTDKLHIKGLDMIKDEMETITWSQFIEETLNVKFEEVYKDYILHGVVEYEKDSDLE